MLANIVTSLSHAHIALLLIFTVTLAAPAAYGETDPTHSAKIIGTRMLDSSGQTHQIGMVDTVLKEVVLTFVTPQCFDPEAISQSQDIARQQGRAFYVVTAMGTQWSDAAALAKELHAPVLLDADGNLAAETGIHQAGYTSVISKYDDILQTGRLSAQDLVRGHGETATLASGCTTFEHDIPKAVRYNEHLAPMLQANCVECHRTNGIAPFPLLDYAAARNFAPVIAYVTAQKIMPPWQAAPNSAHYLNERTLSDRQIQMLKTWSDQGAPEGSPAAHVPVPQVSESKWRLGEPDIIIEMPEAFDIPAGGPDIYRYFVVPDAIPKDLEIATIDFLPGDASVVHHTNFFVDYGKRARAKDAEDDEVGFSVFGTGGFFSYWDQDNTAAGLGAWAPGGNPIRYPDGIGMQIPGGADFVFEVHYHPTGKATTDQSRLGIYLAKKPIKRAVSGLFMGTNRMSIKPDETDHKRHFWMTLPTEMTLVDIAPHMHYLGTHATVVATLPDGNKQTLLDTKWDFRWQGAYYYREPLILPKGTRIDAHYAYDNSSANPYNPYNPPVRASWGWGTDQEMGELYLTVIADNQRQLKALQTAAFESWMRPSNPELSNANLTTAEILDQLQKHSTWSDYGGDLLLLLMDSQARIKAAKKQLKKRMREDKNNATLWAIRGALSAVQAQYATSYLSGYSLYADAVRDYEKAIALNADHWDAHYGLASMYAADEGYQKSALDHYQRLLQIQDNTTKRPARYAQVYLELGQLLERHGQKSAAEDIWRLGFQNHPTEEALRSRATVAEGAE